MKLVIFYSMITFSYTKYSVHSYTADVVFTLSYGNISYGKTVLILNHGPSSALHLAFKCPELSGSVLFWQKKCLPETYAKFDVWFNISVSYTLSHEYRVVGNPYSWLLSTRISIMTILLLLLRNGNDFHSRLGHSWKSLSNWLTHDKKNISGYSVVVTTFSFTIVLYITKYMCGVQLAWSTKYAAIIECVNIRRVH